MTEAPPTTEPFTRYYQACVERWSDDERYALDKRFVQLTLLLDQGEDAQGPRWQAASETFRDLGEVLQHVTAQAIVLLGPPGSGKSTLLRHYELDNARGVLTEEAADHRHRAPLTFFVLLNDYRPDPEVNRLPVPLDWLTAQWAARYPDLLPLETILQQRRMTLLLDALNEMPATGSESPIRLWKAFLTQVEQHYPGNRVVFSCRSLDYSVTLSSRQAPVPQVRIEPLSDAQVQEFIVRYCPQHAAVLWQNLRDTPQLEVLRSPYYLKLLIAQTSAGEIPHGRAALFTGFVRQALQREVAGDNALFEPGHLLHTRDVHRLSLGHGWPPFALPEAGPLLPQLSALAFHMQTRHTTDEATQVRVAYGEALDLLNHAHADDMLSAGVALGVLEQDLGRDEVLYVHQLLQEYFAARYLSRQPQPDLVHQEWHVERVMPTLQDTVRELADADPLPPLPNTGWEVTTVLAAAMAPNSDRVITDLMEHNLALAGRCAAQPEVTISDDLKDRVRWALVHRTQDASADLRARIATGLALGEVGDPRFERRHGPFGAYLLPPLVEIPGGTYHIGSDDGLYEDEAPVHEVEVQPFAIGQFPVTNAEWALFMQAGGYEDEQWWETEAAKAWHRGEGIAEGLKKQWRDHRKSIQDDSESIRQWHQEGRITSQQVEHWEQIARISDDAFESILDAWYPSGRQTQSAFWNDNALNNPAQPLVGICWLEALAYCVWLSVQTGQPFRLPTEAEWEAAARGTQSRRYAYGNDFDASRGNTFESHIRRTTPIGVFPGGETPEGVVDLTGNTWDWTSSLYQAYPYDTADGREDHTNLETPRVVRGGSWYGNRNYARAAYRLRNHPLDRLHFLGLRVVRSSPSSA